MPLPFDFLPAETDLPVGAVQGERRDLEEESDKVQKQLLQALQKNKATLEEQLQE